MCFIVSNILSLEHHLMHLQQNIELYRPPACPYCGKPDLWFHGMRFRKSDRENPPELNLNPIPIPRYRCNPCGATCSSLPECIPPRRWYMWKSQELTLVLVLLGYSLYKISSKNLPSQKTINRWSHWAWGSALVFSDVLRARYPELGYQIGETLKFWKVCLARMSLSHAMVVIHQSGIDIP